MLTKFETGHPSPPFRERGLGWVKELMSSEQRDKPGKRKLGVRRSWGGEVSKRDFIYLHQKKNFRKINLRIYLSIKGLMSQAALDPGSAESPLKPHGQQAFIGRLKQSNGIIDWIQLAVIKLP